MLSDRWVAYPQGQAALQRLEELLRGAQRTRMPSLLVVGDPDMGKTTILRKFMRGRSATFDPEPTEMKSRLPSSCNACGPGCWSSMKPTT